MMKYGYKKIASPSNPMIREAVKIKNRHGSRNDIILIEGSHLIETAVLSSLTDIENIFFTEKFINRGESQKFFLKIPDIKKVMISEQILSLLADTESPQGIFALVHYKSFELEQIFSTDDPLLVICDAIQEPGNIGTIIRASDVFGANAVIILPHTCDPFNPKAIRATAGSLFNIPVIHAEQNELLKYLQMKNIYLLATSSKAKNSIYRIDFKKPSAIVFGNEASGVSNILQKKAGEVFKIPIRGKAESLNVAMAASIVLYEIARQRRYL